MTDSQKKETLNLLITVLMTLLTPDTIKEFVIHLLKFIESKVKTTINPIDDAIVIPVCQKVREAFGITE